MTYALLGMDAEAQQDIERAVELGVDRAFLKQEIKEGFPEKCAGDGKIVIYYKGQDWSASCPVCQPRVCVIQNTRG